jgi:hypothetical protein
LVLVTPTGTRPAIPDGELAYAFHPDDAELQRRWNAAMHSYVGSESHQQLSARFGFRPSDLGGWNPPAVERHP